MKLIHKFARPVTAIALAASLTLSPVVTAPAKAGEADLYIAGAIGTVLLGALAVNSLNNGNARVIHTTPQHNAGRNQHGGHRGGQHRGGHRAAKIVPAQCEAPAFSNGRNSFYRSRCLQNNMRGANRLPNHCKTTVINHRNGNRRTLYNGRCLSRAGYKVAGHGGRRH